MNSAENTAELQHERCSWPIVVGGCYRSGTSLVRRLFNAHPRIHCGPEVKFFRDLYGDYLNDPLDHLRFTTTARSLVPQPELLEVLGRAFVKLHQQAAVHAGKCRWADKAPENVLYLEQWERLLRDKWLFVFVVRNPLDTLASIKEVEFPLSIAAELDQRISMYRRYVEAALEYARDHPERSYTLVYEQLVTEPADSLSACMSWLGETFDPRQLRFGEADHGSGLEDPKVQHTSGVHTASLYRWPRILEADEAASIWSGTSDLWQQFDCDGRYCAGPSSSARLPA